MIASWLSWLRRRITPPPNTQQRADFYELLAGFTVDGIPTFEALVEIDRQYRRFGNPMAVLTSRIVRRMRGADGRVHSFSGALNGLVPVIEAVAVSSGEDAGDVADGLRRAAGIARINQEISQTIHRELAYPIALLLMLAALLVVVSTHVVPAMAEVLPEALWPSSARLVAALSRATPWLLGGGAILLGGGAIAFLALRSRWTGPLREWLDRRVFPWSLHRRTSGALILASLATLIRIGIPFSHALEKLTESGGAWERAHLARIRSRLRRGEREGEALATPLFDDDLRWQIQLYGQMSRFSEALDAFSTRSLGLVQARIRRSFAVLRTLLLITVAATIFWIYSAFLAITLTARTL